ncbi:MAG: aminoacyl-tRNA hydrolase [Eubacteriales bacterium]
MADIFELFKKISTENASREPISHVVVGLGNPGAEYLHTRHNAGFLAIDCICRKYGATVNRSSHKGLLGEANIAGKRVILVKPQTFMNLSGECVRAVLDFYKISPDNLIVIYDDISLPVGRLRVRRDGSAGGHNGIKSIIEHLGTQTFPRIKIGVGEKPHPDYDLASWVLSEFSDSELKTLESTLPTVCEGLEKILSSSVDDAMQICNKKN